MPVQTIIKPSNDISGDRVTLDFQDLLTVAGLAVGKCRDAVNHEMAAIQDNIFPENNPSRAFWASERLTREAASLQKALQVYSHLYALTQGNRETLRIFNLQQECQSIIWDRDVIKGRE